MTESTHHHSSVKFLLSMQNGEQWFQVSKNEPFFPHTLLPRFEFLFGFVLVTFIASHSRLPQRCFDTYNTKSFRLHSGLNGQNQCICVHLLLDNAFDFFNWSFRAGIKTILLVDLMQNGLQLSYSDKRKTLAIQSHRQTKKNAQI